MKQFLQIAYTVSILCLCCFIVAPQACAEGIVSSSAISLDLAVGSVEIYESEGITYCVQNEVTQASTGGVILRQTDSGTIATANTVTASGGCCKITISGLNIEAKDNNSPILVKRDATLDLNLLGNSTVKGGEDCAGIQVPDRASITISGTGSISATGGKHSAGIGGGKRYGGGTITINSGTIIATGGDGYGGAGIGGGDNGNGGTITITGGNITANGGINGAGIGGGWTAYGGTVTISDGVVTAVGGDKCAGIGGGWESKGGIVIIDGGVVTVQGDRFGDADIGATYGYTFDAVTISESAIVADREGGTPYVVETIFIDKQPWPSAAQLSNSPKVSVTAHGNSGLSYQWEISSDNKNWYDLEGEISSATESFTMTEDLVGNYLRCKLTNGWGNVEYTDTVQIYVLAFAQQPMSVDANLNDMVALEALSTCANVTYQWQRSYDDGVTWTDVSGETYSTLLVTATLSESAAKYRCIITATNGDQLASDVVSVNLDLGELVTYTVQDFFQNTDGIGYAMASQQVLEGVSGETVTAIGKDYDGFALNTGKSTLSGTVAEDSSLVLTRYYDRNTYAITFDTNGGSALPDLEALYGASIAAPGTPTRYGQVFDGWYTDKNLTEEYSFDTMPLGGATVYAKWVPVGANRGIEYTINSLAIRDNNNFELLEEIPNGSFLAEVSVTNLDAAETDTIMLVYYTDAGQMIGMNYMFANIPISYTATFGAAVDNTSGNIGIIRAFVLPSLGNPIPLAESKSIGQ